METFILYGAAHAFTKPARPEGAYRDTKHWAYGEYPQVHATIPLVTGSTIGLYGHATAWTPAEICVGWVDDNLHHFYTWVSKADVRPATESEWDIYEYNKCPENLRDLRWGNRLPGFVPASWND